MLFQSPEFLFVFLPVVLAGFTLLRTKGRPFLVLGWLAAASMVFYARWSPAFLLLLLASTGVNYALGLGLDPETGAFPRQRRVLLLAGLAFNLAILGYFKYRGFFMENWNALFGTRFAWGAVVLPLGISFFSFQKVAYLIDIYRGARAERNFGNYLLFVLFFPQLIAGPIVHPAEVLPQFRTAWTGPVDWSNVRRGLVLFVIGLAKKVILADNLSRMIGSTFSWAGQGGSIGAAEAWTSALGYTFQLYFDFSGYCDMAIGLGLLFNIRLPFNFDSPYHARTIQEFWQRWHMTLSRFIRDYLYIPLGGNRGGLLFHYRNLLLTMLLAGLWHGAGWHFVLWGGLHGLYLAAHDLWKRNAAADRRPWWGMPLTFLAVVAAWVLFRADSLGAAGHIYWGMAGLDGLGRMPHGNLTGWLVVGALLVFLAPNSQQWAGIADRPFPWSRAVPLPATRAAAFALAALAFFSILAIYRQPASEFIYFNF